MNANTDNAGPTTRGSGSRNGSRDLQRQGHPRSHLGPSQVQLMSDNYNARLATRRIPDPPHRLALFSDN